MDTSRYSSQALPAQRSGKYVTCAISDLRVVTWVLAENPQTEGNLGFDYSTVDVRDYRLLRVRLPKPDGKFLHVQMLRSLLWMEYENAYRGNVIQLEYPELGIAGRAEVLEVLPCPEIPTRPSAKHCLVTSKFEHDATEVLDVEIAGLPAPIGVTPNHPFWSHDRQQFVQAGELITGETFFLADDNTTHVVAITQRPKPEKVYNLEVDGEHVYYVSASGVLVHNACHGYAIMNNKTGEILKFGVSRGDIVKGMSSRGQNQLTKIAKLEGIIRSDISSVLLRTFANDRAMFKWENEIVGFFRGSLKHPLKYNKLPKYGISF